MATVVRGTNLTPVQLDLARDELRVLLDAFPRHVDAVLDAVRQGKINGAVYQDLDQGCACLVGWFCNASGQSQDDVLHVIYSWLYDIRDAGDSRYLARNVDWATDIECLIRHIEPGHKPRHRLALRLVEQWIVEWQAERAANLAQSLAHQQEVAVELFTGDRLPEETM